MEALKAIVEKNPGSFRIPNARCKIYKEECMYSFQNIDSPEGIYVDLNSWMSFSLEYAQENYVKTKNPLYLRIKRTPIPPDPEAEKEAPKILGVGVEGGFNDGSNAKFLWDYAITIFPTMEVIL